MLCVSVFLFVLFVQTKRLQIFRPNSIDRYHLATATLLFIFKIKGQGHRMKKNNNSAIVIESWLSRHTTSVVNVNTTDDECDQQVQTVAQE